MSDPLNKTLYLTRLVYKGLPVVPGIGMWAYDPHGNSLSATEEAYKLLGIPWSTESGALSIESLKKYLSEDSLHTLLSALQDEVPTLSLFVRTAGISRFTKWIQMNGELSAEDGMLRGFMYDITASRKALLLNETMFSISKAINASASLPDLLRIIHQELRSVIDADNLVIGLYDSKNDEIVFPYFVDKRDQLFTITNASKTDSLTARIVFTGKPLFLDASQLLERRKDPTRQYWGSVAKVWVGVPLVSDGEVIGACALQSYEDGDLYSEDDIPLLSVIAEHIALAINKKREQEKLMHTIELFHIINRGVSDMIAIVDADGNRLFASESYKRIFGDMGPGLGVVSFTDIHPEDKEQMLSVFRKTVATGIGQRAEYRFLLSDGTVRYIESQGNVLKNEENEVERIVLVSRDITERKEAEHKILELNRTLESRVEARTQELSKVNEDLQSEITIRERAEVVQKAIYEISESVHLTKHLENLYSTIHQIVSRLMPADNFFIALRNAEDNSLTYAYRVDKMEKPSERQTGRMGLSELIIHERKPLLVRKDEMSSLMKEGVIDYVGTSAAVWLGAPLMVNGVAAGLIAVQDYENAFALDERHTNILGFVSEQIAIAIERKRREEEERLRLELTLEHRDIMLELLQLGDLGYEETIREIYNAVADSLNIERVGLWKIDHLHHQLVSEKVFKKSKADFDYSEEGEILPVFFPGKAEQYDSYLKELKKNKPMSGNIEAESISDEKLRQHLLQRNIKTLIDTPVWVHGEIWGIVCCEAVDETKALSLEEEGLLMSLATIVSLSITNRQRLQAEESLKISEEKYRSVVEKSGEPMIVVQDTIIRYANPAADNLFHFASGGLLGKPFTELFHKEEKGMVIYHHLTRLWGEAKPESRVVRIITGNQEVRWVQMQTVRIDWQKLEAVLCLMQDVTDRKRWEEEIQKALEKERELSELRKRFVQMASHEFKTPLTAILANTEIIERYGESLSAEKKTKSLGRIKHNVATMNGLLNDILLMGKIGSDKKRETVRVSALLEEIVSDFEDNAAISTGHKFSREFLCDCDINGDMLLLRHLFQNLISNAVKYSPTGSTVTVASICNEKEVTISVSDEGIGIPAGEAEHLFQPFHRASNVGTIQGTGLGLSIVLEAVRAHAGTITCFNNAGKGATFKVTLPITIPNKEA